MVAVHADLSQLRAGVDAGDRVPSRARFVEFTCERSVGRHLGLRFSRRAEGAGGKAKVQWKVDWALRWYVLKVDYELYGKDLIDSARLSGQIVRVLGAQPPLGFPFEMFLDEDGRKVSKSVGRGVTVEQWPRYALIEVLKFFLILNPRRARKLFLEAIPQYVDEYLDALREYAAASEEQRRESVLEFVIQSTTPRRFKSKLSFGMMMNLVAALGSSDRDFIWNYIVHYDASIAGDPETEAMGRALMECALNFYRDFIEPAKKPYTPTDTERAQLKISLRTCAKTRARAPKRSKRRFTISAAKITTSPARFSRCSIARCSARSAARAWARSSGSPPRRASSNCSRQPSAEPPKRIRRTPSRPTRGRGRSV